MWMVYYLLASVCVDVVKLSLSVIEAMQLQDWPRMVAVLIKLVVMLILIWRAEPNGVRALMSMSCLSLGFCVALILRVPVPGLRLSRVEADEISFLLINRVIETLVILMHILWKDDSADGRNNQQVSNRVAPEPCPDVTTFMLRTCTWVEAASDLEKGGEAESTNCCICLETIELDEVVTQLVCRHAFHSHCLFGWIARYRTSDQGPSVCPMRCSHPECVEVVPST
eukprot:TRINITY_DN20533_c1_g1_i1.p1 TRINITY_DN20533_c1_g1~~TRINITY_DN20533_c1_g1_i1.p1  ORF type:complete len:226 (+),score=25.16 TRINITY_DN20533_c1_g1_i1:71-748(+)